MNAATEPRERPSLVIIKPSEEATHFYTPGRAGRARPGQRADPGRETSECI